jgi:nitroreductase
VQDAPLALIFVADFAKAPKMREDERDRYAAVDTGYISQNIYLFCASEGLATVVHELSDRDSLAKALRLRPDQKVILAQTVGFPKSMQSGK